MFLVDRHDSPGGAGGKRRLRFPVADAEMVGELLDFGEAVYEGDYFHCLSAFGAR
jgi:hypothetical protein